MVVFIKVFSIVFIIMFAINIIRNLIVIHQCISAYRSEANITDECNGIIKRTIINRLINTALTLLIILYMLLTRRGF